MCVPCRAADTLALALAADRPSAPAPDLSPFIRQSLYEDPGADEGDEDESGEDGEGDAEE